MSLLSPLTIDDSNTPTTCSLHKENGNSLSTPSQIVERYENLPLQQITAIEEISNNSFDGWHITTTTQTISLLIDNSARCCETWGHELILSVGITREQLIGCIVYFVKWARDDENNATGDLRRANILISTSCGPVYLQVWCEQNGYYSHEVTASWKGYTDTQEL